MLYSGTHQAGCWRSAVSKGRADSATPAFLGNWMVVSMKEDGPISLVYTHGYSGQQWEALGLMSTWLHEKYHKNIFCEKSSEQNEISNAKLLMPIQICAYVSTICLSLYHYTVNIL